MLSMGLILAVMSVAVEMFFVIQYDGIRQFMLRHERFGLIFSFFLSFFIGEVFGAHGVIALFAGMTSTVITAVIYQSDALRLVDTWRMKRGEISANLKSSWNKFLNVMRFWWKVICFPYTCWCAVKAFFQRAGEQYRRTKAFIHR